MDGWLDAFVKEKKKVYLAIIAISVDSELVQKADDVKCSFSTV